MSTLFIDEGILADPAKWSQNKEVFEKALEEYIENHYKGEDSAAVYALFTPEQIKILQWYFKGYSIEEYKELAGTVDLQISERNEKVRKKIQSLCDYMDIKKADISDWEYDGLVDAGPDANFKCDLCPHPVRYAHYAVNKHTHECLRFGCNCAADFFSLDQGRLAAMKSLQAKTLTDIKIIACITDLKLHNEYYKYKCGYVGRIYLESGIDGLRDLMTFSVEWEDGNKRLKGDVAKDLFPITYGNNEKAEKSLEWIKSHIVSCLNADLSDDMYSDLSIRSVVYVDNKAMSDKSLDNSFYITYAVECLKVDLPIPYSICKKINSITSKVAKQHHPDYLKFAEELLMQRNLANNSLLRTAFKEFIVNYLASSMNISDRDPELYCWGIRGQKTYYNTVLNWESMLMKLTSIKQVDDMISDGLITEEEWRRKCRPPRNSTVRELSYYSRMKEFIEKCKSLFMSDGKVLKDEKQVMKGFSKYSLEGVDTKLSLDLTRLPFDIKTVIDNWYLPDTLFLADSIPYYVGTCYLSYQNGFRDLTITAIKNISIFTRAIADVSTDDRVIRILCALKQGYTNATSINAQIYSSFRYMSYNPANIDREVDRLDVNDAFVKKVTKKYKDKIPAFKEACKVLSTELNDIADNVAHIKFEFVKKSDINNDYDDIIEKKKTARDYFEEYTNLLIGPRLSPEVMKYMNKNNIVDVCAFKGMEPYVDMLEDILVMYMESKKDEAESKVYEVMGLDYFTEKTNNFLSKGNEELLRDAIVSWGKDRRKTLLVSSDDYVHYKISDENFELCKKECREEFNALIEKIKVLNSEITPALRFASYLNLLDKDTTSIEEELNMVTSAEGFKTLLYQELHVARYSQNIYINTILDYFATLKDFKGFVTAKSDIETLFNDFYDRNMGAVEKAEKEKAEKESLVVKIKQYLEEHIKFFEVDVDLARKKNSSYPKKKAEAAIRRAEAFRTIHFEDSAEGLTKFIDELNLIGKDKWSEDVDKYIATAISLPRRYDSPEVKKYVKILHAEMLNQVLIYNHFEVTHKLLLDLKKIDLYLMTNDELTSLKEILGVYYILKSDFDTIRGLIEKYGSISFDLEQEIKDTPIEKFKTAKEIFESFEDKADSTGYNGLEKARVLYNHPEYNNLDTSIKSIIKNTVYSKECTSNMRVYIDKAYDKLILDKTEELSDNVKKAKEVLEHKDFATLPQKTQDIVKYAVYKNMCSDKMLKYVESAYSQLILGKVAEPTDGVKKAKEVLEHKDFATLPDKTKDIVKYAVDKNICTDRMLKYVNNAYDKLILGKAD